LFAQVNAAFDHKSQWGQTAFKTIRGICVKHATQSSNASLSAVYSLQSAVCTLHSTVRNLQQSSRAAGVFPLETRQTIGDSHCHFWPVFLAMAKSAKCTKLATGLESRWGGCCCFCYCSESKESQMTANARSKLRQWYFNDCM